MIKKKRRRRVKEKYPFIILLVCDFIMLYYLIDLSHITDRYYMTLKIILGFCLIFMAIYSMNKKKYRHMFFFLIVLFVVHPFIRLDLIMTLSWRIVIVISLLVLIVLTYLHYPAIKHTSIWWNKR
ncbi:MAG: hypothetical protein GY756_24600 [bacterium]|nr:hypothetical protein [bacterium]